MIEKWKLSLKEFLKQYEENDKVVGAILCGSYANSSNDEYSNINVYLILKDGICFEEKGCSESNSYFIEYIIRTSSKIEECMEKEFEEGWQTTANMLAYGKIIYDLDGSAKRIQNKALEYIDKRIDNITGYKLDINNYHLWHYLDELKLSLRENNPDFNLMYYSLLGEVYNKYAEFLALPKLPKTKIYKILTNEDYRRKWHVFKLPEEEFIKLYIKCFEIDRVSVMYKNIYDLISYYYERQGGFNIRKLSIKTSIN